MCGVYTPPVVGKYVEDAQNKDEECGRPLCFETNGDHDTGGETEYWDEDARDAPRALEDESKEKEDQEDTTSEKETRHRSINACFEWMSNQNGWRLTISCGLFRWLWVYQQNVDSWLSSSRWRP